MISPIPSGDRWARAIKQRADEAIRNYEMAKLIGQGTVRQEKK